jgi:RND family efflux transporter MFP subunit
MTPRRWAFVRLVATTLVASGACAACGGAHSEEEVTASAPVPVAMQPAARGDVEATITASGVIAAAPGAELIVIAPQSARIARLPKGEGDAVRKGDLLVEFDIPSSQADVAARQAELTQARARLTNTRNALTRLQGLFDRGVAARKEVEDAQRDVAETEAAVTNGETASGAAQRVASRATVVAPFSGVIGKRWHNPGDLVEAAATDPVLRVIDPARTEVTAAIPASAANRVHPGQTARIRGASGGSTSASAPASAATDDASEGAAFWPASVLTRPTVVDPATATASVRIALRKTASLSPLGTAVRADIVTDVHKNVVTVPPSAIVRNEGKTFVYVAGSDKKAHRHEVKLGVASEAAIEVVSGIAAGDSVIVRGHEALPDGAAIRPEESAEKPDDKDDKDAKAEKSEKGEKGDKPGQSDKADAKADKKDDKKDAGKPEK